MARRIHRARHRYDPIGGDTKARIFWSPEHNMYAIKTPKAGGEIFTLDMRLIDGSKFEGTAKVWLVPEGALQDAIAVVTSSYGIPEVDTKPDANANSVSDNICVTDAATAALKMFQVGGYDNAKKVYSILIKQYHPDLNPSPEAKTKAAEITTAWRTLKLSLGWN